FEEAVAADRAAIRLSPNVGSYHNNLGVALQGLGRLEEAAEEYRLALRHAPGDENARANLRNLGPWLLLLPRLEALLRGKAQPTEGAECPKLAHLCRLKGVNRTAAGLFADGFAADPKLADALERAHRYNAATSAALAAAGQGEDAKHLPDR